MFMSFENYSWIQKWYWILKYFYFWKMFLLFFRKCSWPTKNVREFENSSRMSKYVREIKIVREFKICCEFENYSWIQKLLSEKKQKTKKGEEEKSERKWTKKRRNILTGRPITAGWHANCLAHHNINNKPITLHPKTWTVWPLQQKMGSQVNLFLLFCWA